MRITREDTAAYREELKISINNMLTNISDTINLNPQDISFQKISIEQIRTDLNKLAALFNRQGNQKTVYLLATQYLLLLRRLLTGEDLILKVGVETSDGKLQQSEISMTDSKFFSMLEVTKHQINYTLDELSFGKTIENESLIWQQLMEFGTPTIDDVRKNPTIILNRKKSAIQLYQKTSKDTWVFKGKNNKGSVPGWYTSFKNLDTRFEDPDRIFYYNRGWLFQYLENYVNQKKDVENLKERITNNLHPISTFLKMTNAKQDNRSFLSGGDVDVYQVKIDNKKLLSRHQCKQAILSLSQAFNLLCQQKLMAGTVIKDVFTNTSTKDNVLNSLLKNIGYIFDNS